MDTNLALLLLLSPFVGFLFNIFFGNKISKGMAGVVGTLTVVFSFLLRGLCLLVFLECIGAFFEPVILCFGSAGLSDLSLHLYST